MSLDDALALAGRVLADYETADAQDAPGLALVWADQFADVLRKLAAAARHVGTARDLALSRLPGSRRAVRAGPGAGWPGSWRHGRPR